MKTLNSSDSSYLLPSKRNVVASAEDIYINVSLETNSNPFIPDDITRYFSSKEQFEKERRESLKFNLTGKINFISLFNGFSINDINTAYITNDPSQRITFADIIDGNIDNRINSLFEFFNFYLCYNHQNINLNDGTFIRQFKIIGMSNEVLVDHSGFEFNVFGENVYQYIVNKVIDISGLTNGFGLPLTEVFLYVQWKGINQLNRKDYITQLPVPLLNTMLLPTDIIYGDRATFDNINFQVNVVEEQHHTILFPKIQLQNLKSNGISYRGLQNFYNPFIKIPLKTFSASIEEAYFADTANIPKYSYVDSNGLNRWRDLLDIGYIENNNGSLNGYDWPFLNGEHHVFNALELDMNVDLKHADTTFIFREVVAKSSMLTPKATDNIQTEQC